MNLRVFRSTGDLREALFDEVTRIVSSTITPYVGVIGSPDAAEWLLDRMATSERIVLAGHPEDLEREIHSRENLELASPEDLLEPLDLAVLLTLGSESLPSWVENARGILLAPDSDEAPDHWIARSESSGERSWTFLLQEQWERWRSDDSKEAI